LKLQIEKKKKRKKIGITRSFSYSFLIVNIVVLICFASLYVLFLHLLESLVFFIDCNIYIYIYIYISFVWIISNFYIYVNRLFTLCKYVISPPLFFLYVLRDSWQLRKFYFTAY